MTILLCVGGPSDGKRVECSEMTHRIYERVGPQKSAEVNTVTYTDYERRLWHAGEGSTANPDHQMLVPVGQTNAETMRLLMEGYRSSALEAKTEEALKRQ